MASTNSFGPHDKHDLLLHYVRYGRNQLTEMKPYNVLFEKNTLEPFVVITIGILLPLSLCVVISLIYR